MNDDRSDALSFDKSGILRQIVGGLSKHPSYLLLFAIIVSTLLFSFYAFAFQSEEQLKQYSLAGLVIESVLAMVLVWLMTSNREKREIAEFQLKVRQLSEEVESSDKVLAKADVLDINIPHDGIRKEIEIAVSKIRKALNYKNDTFHAEMEAVAATFAERCREWEDGELLTDAINYEKILKRFYSQARHSVFATSNQYYLSKWSNKDQAKQIMDAHQTAFNSHGTTVTRIFILPTLDAVQENLLKVIEDQETRRFITVRVLIADDHRSLAFAANLLKDFVIIDRGHEDQVIGIESSSDLNTVGATWLFRRQKEIENTAERVLDISMSTEELRDRISKGN